MPKPKTKPQTATNDIIRPSNVVKTVILKIDDRLPLSILSKSTSFFLSFKRCFCINNSPHTSTKFRTPNKTKRASKTP